ncbi:helix-hairpin-helix domain-containing protein [Carboxylicivirga sediminis]|uniref:Helix-hairpin-helix domain-containing protein n=1 Tax=Carboxylicivirga sediminis TaxID=2006564 RepID=A0A941F074_9BACT|nr:helix-hairpin-helix domain-containing protein [Carboxylicivirga sediminis]MBR8534167.1 helix-hairpin-helix domain-containing protein [Carboxylicivirga sediminis]
MWRDLLTLSKREQLALLTLVVLLVLVGSVFFITPRESKVYVDQELIAWAEGVSVSKDVSRKTKPDTVFFFNPNHESVSRLQILGFSTHAIINLLKYREAGGKIKTPEKLKSIYGVDSVLYAKLENYILCDDVGQKASYQTKKWLSYAANNIVEREDEHIKTHQKTEVLVDVRPKLTIEINSADTAMFALLRGIGPVLSKRIVAYRNRIGGYCSVEQLGEVYGLSMQVIEQNREYLKVDDKLVMPMDITKASLKQMKNHPYLDFYMAKDIYEIRKAGQLNSIMQFRDSLSFAKADMQLLARYFVVDVR